MENLLALVEMIARGDAKMQLSRGTIGTDNPAVQVTILHKPKAMQKVHLISTDLIASVAPDVLMREMDALAGVFVEWANDDSDPGDY